MTDRECLDVLSTSHASVMALHQATQALVDSNAHRSTVSSEGEPDPRLQRLSEKLVELKDGMVRLEAWRQEIQDRMDAAASTSPHTQEESDDSSSSSTNQRTDFGGMDSFAVGGTKSTVTAMSEPIKSHPGQARGATRLPNASP